MSSWRPPGLLEGTFVQTCSVRIFLIHVPKKKNKASFVTVYGTHGARSPTLSDSDNDTLHKYLDEAELESSKWEVPDVEYD